MPIEFVVGANMATGFMLRDCAADYDHACNGMGGKPLLLLYVSTFGTLLR